MDGSRRVISRRAIRKVSCELIGGGSLAHNPTEYCFAFTSAIVDRKKELIKYKGWQGS